MILGSAREPLTQTAPIIPPPHLPTHPLNPTPPAAPPLVFEGRAAPFRQAELNAAVALLTRMAAYLPLPVVRTDVAALLTCHQPFLDFKLSDASARGALLLGSFELLAALAGRAGPGAGVVKSAVGRLMGLVGVLVDEYEELMRLKASPQCFDQVRGDDCDWDLLSVTQSQSQSQWLKPPQ